MRYFFNQLTNVQKILNSIIIGDNLPVLRKLDSESIDMIYIDPPFNKTKKFYGRKGNEFDDDFRLFEKVFKNKAEKDAIVEMFEDFPELKEQLSLYRKIGQESEYNYCTWLAVRLVELHRILKNEGTIFLHCDHTMNNHIELLLQIIFGWEHCINEIIWCYSGGGHSKKAFPRKHDVIFWFRKGKKWTYNPMYRKYGEHIKTGGGKRATDLGGTRSVEYSKKGTPITDWWTTIKPLLNWSAENVGQATQKPVALIERIINASTNEQDIVLDAFAGCGTTLVAASRLQRKFIGIELQNKSEIETRIERGDMLDDYQPKFIKLKDIPDRTSKEVKRRLPLKQIKEILYKKQKGICKGCKEETPKKFMEVDHIFPKSKGGLDDISNRQLLCSICNRSKGSKAMEEWLGSRYK